MVDLQVVHQAAEVGVQQTNGVFVVLIQASFGLVEDRTAYTKPHDSFCMVNKKSARVDNKETYSIEWGMLWSGLQGERLSSQCHLGRSVPGFPSQGKDRVQRYRSKTMQLVSSIGLGLILQLASSHTALPRAHTALAKIVHAWRMERNRMTRLW